MYLADGFALELRPLSLHDETEALSAHDELAPFEFLLDRTDGPTWAEYVERLAEIARGERLDPDRVPATFLVGVVDGEVAGRVSVRHELNDWLLAYGGHIGYGVRPAFRRRGVATALLATGLRVLHAQGTGSALLTCDDTNVGSATVIERAGGVLEDVRTDPDGNRKRRYWVPTG